MREDNKIKINTGARHFDIPSRSEPVNLRVEEKPEIDSPGDVEMEFFKKRNSRSEVEENDASNDRSSDRAEKSSESKGFLGKFGAKRFAQKAPHGSMEPTRSRSMEPTRSRSMEPTADTPLASLKRGIDAVKPTAFGAIFDKAILGLIYLLVFSLPLFVLPLSMEIYEFNKTILLFILSSLAFLIWIAKMILVEKRLTFVRTPLDMPIVAFISLAIISTAFSLDKISSILGFYGRFSDSLMVYLSLAMVYFVVINIATHPLPPLKRGMSADDATQPTDITGNILKIFLASSFIVVVAGLLYSFGFKFMPWPEAQFRSFNLVAGSVNVLGIYLTSVILVALYYRNTSSFSNSGSIGKNLMSTLIIMSIILLAIIDFVMAWIILAISLTIALVLIFLIRRRHEVVLPLKNIIFFPFLLILVSLVFVATSLTFINKDVNSDFLSSSISTSIKSRLLSLDDDQVADSDRFTREIILDKETAVTVAIGGIKDDPIAGVIGSGPGTYLYNFSKFKPAEFNNNAFWNIRFDKAGSEIIEKISTVGVLGVLSYLLIVFFAVMMFLKTCWLHSSHRNGTVESKCDPPIESNYEFTSRLHSPAGTMEPTDSRNDSCIYIFVAWFALLLFQFFYLEATTTKFLFWLFTAILAAEYCGITSRFHSPKGTMEPAGCRNSNHFVLDLKKEKSAFYSSLFVLVILLVSFSFSYYYQFRFYQAEVAYKDISINQNRTLEGVNIDNQKVWEILSQRANDIKSKVIERDPYRGEYKAYLSDIYLRRASIVFQEENSKDESERDTQKIALEVKETIDYLKDAADSSPKNIVFQHKLGATYFAVARDLGVSGADSWAVKKYNKAIELEPTNPVLYTEIGKIFVLADQMDLAITEFEKALNLKEDYIDAGLQLGLSYEKQGETQKAIDTLISMGSVQRIDSVIAAGQIVTSQSVDVDIAFQLGRIYYNTNRISEAKNIFIKIVKINPSHSNARYSLGLIYNSEGDKEKALQEFEAVLSLNPENEDVKSKINEIKGISNTSKKEEIKKPEPTPIVEERPEEESESEIYE